jgi:hypothetical protein
VSEDYLRRCTHAACAAVAAHEPEWVRLRRHLPILRAFHALASGYDDATLHRGFPPLAAAFGRRHPDDVYEAIQRAYRRGARTACRLGEFSGGTDAEH